MIKNSAKKHRKSHTSMLSMSDLYNFLAIFLKKHASLPIDELKDAMRENMSIFLQFIHSKRKLSSLEYEMSRYAAHLERKISLIRDFEIHLLEHKMLMRKIGIQSKDLGLLGIDNDIEHLMQRLSDCLEIFLRAFEHMELSPDFPDITSFHIEGISTYLRMIIENPHLKDELFCFSMVQIIIHNKKYKTLDGIDTFLQILSDFMQFKIKKWENSVLELTTQNPALVQHLRTLAPHNVELIAAVLGVRVNTGSALLNSHSVLFQATSEATLSPLTPPPLPSSTPDNAEIKDEDEPEELIEPASYAR